MAAKLQGFLLKGPKKLSKTGIQAATKQAKKALEFSKKLLNRIGVNNVGMVDLESYLAKERMDVTPLKHLRLEDINGAVAYIYQQGSFGEIDPAKLITEFVDWWQSAGFTKDSIFKPDTDAKTKQLVFVGWTTAGYEIDTYGFNIVKLMNYLGCLSKLNIK